MMMMSDDDNIDHIVLAADWSELPGDLLGLIMDTLKKNTFFLLDCIRFGAVCFEWRSFSIQNYYKEHIKLPSKLPLLLIPNSSQEDYNDEEEYNGYDDNHDEEEEEEERNYDDEDEQQEQEQEQDPDEKQLQYYYKPKVIWKGQDAETRHKTTRSFYSLSEKKVNQDFRLPVPYYKNCRGSSHGWLVTVDEEQVQQPDGTTYSYPVRLLNPFRSVNNQIQLPPLTSIPSEYGDDEPVDSYFLINAFLSASPSSLSNPADLLVLGVLGRYKFGFCRPGDSSWTHFPLERGFRPIEDLICYRGRFLAIIQNGSVLEFDFAHHLHPKPPPSVKFVARTPANADNLAMKYLVESAGDLLQVQRHVVLIEKGSSQYYSTSGFQVFKLLNDADAADDDDDDDTWVEMDTLDGRMLFLGDNSSISLSAADFPGLMPNCIYFTDNNHEAYEADPWVGPHDIGVFNFKDRSVVFAFGDEKSFYWHYAMDNTIMPPPIWIQPML